MQINLSDGIRVHEVDNEEPTMPTIYLVSTTSAPIQTNKTHQVHDSNGKSAHEFVHIHDDNRANVLNGS